MLILFFGVFLSSLLIFFAVRKFGRDFIYSFVSKDKIEKIENSKWFSDTKKIDLILLILFFIPGTPKDLLVYLGGLLPVKPGRFLLISTFARFPSIISSTIAGAGLINGNWKTIIIAYAITFIITGISVYIIRKKELNKESENSKVEK